MLEKSTASKPMVSVGSFQSTPRIITSPAFDHVKNFVEKLEQNRCPTPTPTKWKKAARSACQTPVKDKKEETPASSPVPKCPEAPLSPAITGLISNFQSLLNQVGHKQN